MKKYLLQVRHDDACNGKPFTMLATARQIIDAYGFDDCSGDRHAVFDAGTFGQVEPLTHIPATTAPYNYHKFVDSRGEVVFDDFNTEH